MTTFNLAGTGAIRVIGFGDAKLRHNLASTGAVRVEGEGGILARHVLGATGSILVTGSGGLELVPPTISTAVATSSTAVRASFDSPMLDNVALSDLTNYSISPTASGSPVAVTAVVPEAVAEPTYVDLTVTEMTDGEGYEVTAQTIEDVQGEEIDPGPTAFTGVGVAPRVGSAVAVNATKVRVIFDEPMDQNGSELADPTNYTITPAGPGAVAVFITSVIANGVTPTEVELVTSEMTEGESYIAEVDSSGPIRDAAFNPLNPAFDSTGFTGKGDAPEVARVVAISESRVDVVFNEKMRDNADIRDPANYVWDNGLVTLSVLDFADDTVKLVTTEQVEGLLYRLTIA